MYDLDGKDMADQLAEIAQAAGAAILALRRQELKARLKSPGQLVTVADQRSHEIIQPTLARRFPGVPLILEEQENPEHLPARYITADELDGTAIYACGFDEWGVTLALVEDGRPVAGVLHQPVRGVTVKSWRGGGTWLDGLRVRLDPEVTLAASVAMVELNGLISEDHVRWLGRIAGQALTARSLCTAVGNTIELLQGLVSVYLNCRGAKVWDFAAAVLAVEEAGGVALSEQGGAIDWRRLPVGALLAANPRVAEAVLTLSPGLASGSPQLTGTE